MRTPRTLMAFGLTLAIASCAEKHPATPTESVSEKPDSSESGSEARRKKLTRHRVEFMTSCTTKMQGGADYCECSWEQLEKTFTEEQMNADRVDDVKMDSFKDRVAAVCANKIPEEPLREAFTKACVKDKPSAASYCDCAWTELRKQVSVADFAQNDAAKSPRFVAAKKAMLKKCGGKAPEDMFRDGFFSGCIKKPELKPFCTCAWSTLRKEASPPELEAYGEEDWARLKPKVEASCSKLRPR